MSKNYYEVSGEIDAVRNKTRTLAISPDIHPAPMKCFKELVVGKIKLWMIDFSNGKGDRSTTAMFNLNLSDFKYLYERAKMMHMPSPFYAEKIWGQSPETSGAYKGMCKSFKLNVTRTPYIEKNGQKEMMRSPWKIEIRNGYGIAVPGATEGTFNEQKNSFKETARIKVNLSDAEMLDRMEAVHAYLEEYRRIVAEKLIPKGLSELNRLTNRNQYGAQPAPEEGPPAAQEADMDAYAGQNTAQAPPQDVQQAAQPATQQTPPKNTASNNPDGQKCYTQTVVITSDFQALEKGAVANCLMNGKAFLVYFPQVDQSLVDAKDRQIPVNMLLTWDSNKNIIYRGMTQ